MSGSLPKFDCPPVIETALGVAFHPILQWQTPHFGLYWSQIRDQYQKCAVRPPLPLETENPAFAKQEMLIAFGGNNERCWFFDDAEEWLVQVQATRFVSNWRRPSGSDLYPNYDGFEDRFLKQWNHFKDFLRGENFQLPNLAVAEVSYINHIEIDDFTELAKIFPSWGTFTNMEFLPSPDAIGFNARFRIEKDKGRLDVIATPVIRHSDGHSIVQMNVTAKTVVTPNEANDGLQDALAIGHKWVVEGFSDFTSPEMHKLWKRTDTRGGQ